MSTVETYNPAALGTIEFPFSQAAVANGFIFLAGQVAVDENNVVVAPGDAYEQTKYLLGRMVTILAKKGATLHDITQTTSFLTDPKYAADYNRAWREVFTEHKPPRATLIAGILLEGIVVEVTAIAALPKA